MNIHAFLKQSSVYAVKVPNTSDIYVYNGGQIQSKISEPSPDLTAFPRITWTLIKITQYSRTQLHTEVASMEQRPRNLNFQQVLQESPQDQENWKKTKTQTTTKKHCLRVECETHNSRVQWYRSQRTALSGRQLLPTLPFLSLQLPWTHSHLSSKQPTDLLGPLPCQVKPVVRQSHKVSQKDNQLQKITSSSLSLGEICLLNWEEVRLWHVGSGPAAFPTLTSHQVGSRLLTARSYLPESAPVL